MKEIVDKGQKVSVRYELLRRHDISQIIQFLEHHLRFYRISQSILEQFIFKDTGYEPSLVIGMFLNDTSELIGIIAGVLRKRGLRKNCALKILIIHSDFRLKGLGTELLKKFQQNLIFLISKPCSVRFDASPPNYFNPGLDFRYSDLIFFLKYHGFKKKGLRNNMICDVPKEYPIPKKKINGIQIKRLSESDIIYLETFISRYFRFTLWDEEVRLTYNSTPITTYIAIDSSNHIVGWASYNISFPGCFGPMGVKKKLRGLGIGGELLRWCLYSLSREGIETMVIRWVSEKTVYFYSKLIGAHISQIYYNMVGKIKPNKRIKL